VRGDLYRLRAPRDAREVDPEVAFGDFAGRLEPPELTELDAGLRLVLGLR
jgi:hypothetical protein